MASGAPTLADVALSVKIEFEKHRGAFLVMYNPRMHVVPDEFYYATVPNKILLGKKLVTQVYWCDGYVLYLSNKRMSLAQPSPTLLANFVA